MNKLIIGVILLAGAVGLGAFVRSCIDEYHQRQLVLERLKRMQPNQPPPVYWCPKCEIEFQDADAQDMGYDCPQCSHPLWPTPGLQEPRAGYVDFAEEIIRQNQRR